MTVDELKKLRETAYKLSIGKDPVTNLDFPQDTVLNCRMIKDYNKKISEILDGLIADSKKKVVMANRKVLFHLSECDKNMIEFSKEPVSISALVYQLNGIISPYMKKLHAMEVTNWLMRQGYLQQKEMANGNKYKVATPLGNEIGIANEKRENEYGNIYAVNLYNEAAQRFVVDHLDDIVE